MARDIKQVYIDNPSTTLDDNDLLYAGKSPYGAENDSAIKSQDIFPANNVVTDGQVVTFNGTSGKKLKPVTLVAGTNMTSVVVNGSAQTITFNAAGGSGITTINGDNGSVTGSTVSVLTDASTANCGKTINFSGSGSTLTLNFTDGDSNTLGGLGAGSSLATGAVNSTSWGKNSLFSATTPGEVTAIGAFAGALAQDISLSVLVGYAAANSLLHGTYNIAIGAQVATNWTNNESNNICIQHAGTAGENNTTRIGTYGSGIGQQNIAYIAGLTTVTSITADMTITDTAGGTPAPLRDFIVTGSFTCTLPANPLNGEEFRFINQDATLGMSVNSNGRNFVGNILVATLNAVNVQNLTAADNIPVLGPIVNSGTNQTLHVKYDQATDAYILLYNMGFTP